MFFAHRHLEATRSSLISNCVEESLASVVPRIKSIKVSNFVGNQIKNLTLNFDKKLRTKYNVVHTYYISLLVTKYYVIKSSEKCYKIRKKLRKDF